MLSSPEVPDLEMKKLLESYRDYLAGASEHDLPLWAKMAVAFFEEVPAPSWIKLVLPGPEFKMIYINKAYYQIVGISPDDYEGKQDSEVWLNETANEFGANDYEVVRTGAFVLIDETSIDPLTGERRR